MLITFIVYDNELKNEIFKCYDKLVIITDLYFLKYFVDGWPMAGYQIIGDKIMAYPKNRPIRRNCISFDIFDTRNDNAKNERHKKQRP